MSKSPEKIRTPEDFFDAMPDSTRLKIEALCRDFVWSWAIATACGMTKDGPVLPRMPKDLHNAIRDASWKVFVEAYL